MVVNTHRHCRGPAYWCLSQANVQGAPVRRLMVVLRTRGCEYARENDGGCTVCGFMNHAEEHVSDEDIAWQLDELLRQVTEEDKAPIGAVDLLTLGSFFNDNEVSPELRDVLLRRVSSLPGLQRVSIESRVEYVSMEKLRRCRALLGDREVELGIGLESADDHVRNEVINKGLDRTDFEAQVAELAEVGISLLTYVLVKPPTLSEAVAVDDAVASAQYVFGVARSYGVPARVALEPVFICPGTPLEAAYLEGSYRLVNLWSVVEVVRRSHPHGPLFVGLSDEDLSRDRLPHGCPVCTDRITDAIEVFNGSQDIRAFDDLDCGCRPRYLRDLYAGVI